MARSFADEKFLRVVKAKQDAKHARLKKIPLVEVFGPTIQGEGAVIGQQTYFLRFGLCDFRCLKCDSMHAVDPKLVRANAEWLTQYQIYQRLANVKLPGSADWVTFSGGNPCIHDLYTLCSLLKAEDWQIAVETQGTIPAAWLWCADIITVSPKSPGMGEKYDPKVFMDFMMKLRGKRGVQVKIVVFDQQDLDFARRVFTDAAIACPGQLDYYLQQGNPWPTDQLSVSELTNGLRELYLELFDKIKEDPILSQVKFLPQFHTWLWGNKAGV